MDGPDVLVAGAILLSAFIGAIIALVVVAQQRILGKKKNAYDMILKLYGEDFARCERVFKSVAQEDEWRPVLQPQDAKQLEIQEQVARYLNHLEFLCVCIRQNIVDEDVIKAILGDKLVRRLGIALPLINMIRRDESDPEFFEHFEHVGKQWKAHPKVQQRNLLCTMLGEIWKV